MLKPWHKEDVFTALQSRGWGGPSPLDVVSPVVGESHAFTRGEEVLKLYFVADIGTGFLDEKSIESVSALIEPGREASELWLHRRRDARWKKELHDWAEQISAAAIRSV